jgi:hypothetical protein
VISFFFEHVGPVALSLSLSLSLSFSFSFSFFHVTQQRREDLRMITKKRGPRNVKKPNVYCVFSQPKFYKLSLLNDAKAAPPRLCLPSPVAAATALAALPPRERRGELRPRPRDQGLDLRDRGARVPVDRRHGMDNNRALRS